MLGHIVVQISWSRQKRLATQSLSFLFFFFFLLILCEQTAIIRVEIARKLLFIPRLLLCLYAIWTSHIRIYASPLIRMPPTDRGIFDLQINRKGKSVQLVGQGFMVLFH